MSRHYTAVLVGLGRIAWRFDANHADGAALILLGTPKHLPEVPGHHAADNISKGTPLAWNLIAS